MFISLHADSAPSAGLSGASVYTLSETASDRESAALAKRENASDEVAGVEITEYPAAIRDILVDLTMRRTLNESSRFADIVVRELRQGLACIAIKTASFCRICRVILCRHAQCVG